ncbi:unnamed protein product [Urochloa humidicola]
MEFMPESEEVLALESKEVIAPEVVVPDSEQLLAPELDDAPESEEVLAPDSLPPGSEMTVLESFPSGAFLCARCHLVHEERESWNRAHSSLWPCAHCSLIHLDYWMGSTIRSIDDFDCAAALDVKREMEEGEQEWRKMNNK